MDDDYFDDQTEYSSNLVKNRLTPVFSESRFGPWNTNRESVLSRNNTSNEKSLAKPRSELKEKSKNVKIEPLNLKNRRHHNSVKITES